SRDIAARGQSGHDQRGGVDHLDLADDLAGLLTAFHRLPASGQWDGVGRGARPLADTAWGRESISPPPRRGCCDPSLGASSDRSPTLGTCHGDTATQYPAT
ncbi:MAG TPA: hypothetical protein PLA44_15140, partial [Propionibacteriaceae bacterium]|nr:hypothetical protein [Propionibacteriaceae bacterium]